jgi:hypothetical protein
MFIVFAYFAWIAYQRYSQRSQQREKAQTEPIYRFLTEVLAGSLSISAIPTGISLMICASYDMTFIKHLSGVEIYVAFAGISILSIGFLAALQESEQISEDKKVNTIEDIHPSGTSENSIGLDNFMKSS